MSNEEISGEVLGVLTGQVAVPEKSVSGNPDDTEFPECDNHIEVQHRDRNRPWCRSCGWNRGHSYPAQQIKEIRHD